MSSHTNRSIKLRKTANDVFYTPADVVNLHISLIDSSASEIWFDPFYGKGAYFNAFPTDKKEWTEIALQKDFFDFSGKCDIICSNPPYSMIDKVLKKSVELEPRIISYLFGFHNLTTKRIEYMNSKGYYLSKLHLLKIYEWFGMSAIAIFEKGGKNCISFERTVFYVEK